MRGNPDVSFTGNGAQRLAEKSPRYPLQNFPLLGGSGPHGSLGPPKAASWSASRSVYLFLLFLSRMTDRPGYSVCGNMPHLASIAMRPNNVMQNFNCAVRQLHEQDAYVVPLVSAEQWRSRTFGRLVRWSNLPPYCLRFWKMDSLFKASRTNA